MKQKIKGDRELKKNRKRNNKDKKKMIKLEEKFTAGTNQIGDKTNKKNEEKMNKKKAKEIKEEKF